MAWHQFSLVTSEQHVDQISDFFSDLGAVSVTYMDAQNQPVYEPLPGETKIWLTTKVIALFELDTIPSQVKSLTDERFHNLFDSWHQEILEDQVWERTWMDHYKPMKFGDRLWVCPTGQQVNEDDTVCMVLDPGLAFGTGTHPTTSLCLDWLAKADVKKIRIIDFGCGSGILAIAAVLLGAKEAIAIDIDPQALIATEENAKKNSVVDKVKCYLPENFKPIASDIVIANILAQPLINLVDTISTLVKPNGHLILSGILNEQSQGVREVYDKQFIVAPAVESEEWSRLDCVKKP